MTEYTMRVTIACPEALRDDANQFAMVIGNGPNDVRTFAGLNWQDADGNLYAVASTLAKPSLVSVASSTLQRPEWDAQPYQVNMAGARRAQATLYIYDALSPLPAAPGRLWAMIGNDPHAALTIAGLKPVPE